MPHLSLVAKPKRRLVLIFSFKIITLRKVVWEAACILDSVLGGLGLDVSLHEFLAMSAPNSHHTECPKYTTACVSDHQNCLYLFPDGEECHDPSIGSSWKHYDKHTTQAKLERCSKCST